MTWTSQRCAVKVLHPPPLRGDDPKQMEADKDGALWAGKTLVGEVVGSIPTEVAGVSHKSALKLNYGKGSTQPEPLHGRRRGRNTLEIQGQIGIDHPFESQGRTPWVTGQPGAKPGRPISHPGNRVRLDRNGYLAVAATGLLNGVARIPIWWGSRYLTKSAGKGSMPGDYPRPALRQQCRKRGALESIEPTPQRRLYIYQPPLGTGGG
jgi:hypothetical protein